MRGRRRRPTLPRHGIVVFVVLAVAGACGSGSSTATPTTTATTATTPPPATNSVVVTVAGDLGASRKEIEPVATLMASIDPDWVILVGDLVYPDGTPFNTWFDTVYGSMKRKTVPAPGNHDYHQPNALDYFQYFPYPPYYAKNLGNHWRAYSLNCEIACTAGSEEERWLRGDLAQHPGMHYLAFDHRPRYTSPSEHSDDPDLSAMWADLQVAGADLFLAGHNHNVERFARMNGTGARDPAGIRSFVVGTGGHGLYPFTGSHLGSEWKDDAHYGTLRLTLKANAFSWQFVAVGGHILDSGSDTTLRTVEPTQR